MEFSFEKVVVIKPDKFCMRHRMNYWFFFWVSHSNACIYSRLLVEWHYVAAVSGLVFYDFNFEIFSTQEILWRAVVGFSLHSFYSLLGGCCCCCLNKCIFHNIKCSAVIPSPSILHYSSSGFVVGFKCAFLYIPCCTVAWWFFKMQVSLLETKTERARKKTITRNENL